MKNAVLLGIEFNSLLPVREIPENTEGYEGFHHLNHMDGCEELASLRYIIRDHSREKFEQKKDFFRRAADFLNAKYGEGTFELKITDSYYNMREVLEDHMELVEDVRRIMESMGIDPISVPVSRIWASSAPISVRAGPTRTAALNMFPSRVWIPS